MKRLIDHASHPSTFALLVAAGALLSGCNPGPALLRVAEINSESTSGSSSTRSSIEISYTDEGRIDEMERTTEGDFDARYEYSYEDGRLVEVEILQDGFSPRTLEIEWTGDQITQMSGRYDDTTEDIELEYLDDDASVLAETRSEVASSGYVSRSETAFEYDDRRRLSEMRNESSAEFNGQVFAPSSTEWQLEYGDDGRPLTIEFTSDNGGNVEVWEADISYDDKGRLEEVDVDDGSDVSVSYDEQGRVVELEQRSGGSTLTVEYVYEDGYTDGFAFLLDGAASLFDLGGRYLERPYVYSTSLIPSP